MRKVREWIEKMEKQKEEEDKNKETIKKLQAQIEKMTREENRKQCPMTGVNIFSALDALQGEGATGVDLAAKAQAAMLSTKRKRDEDDDSEGESITSKVTQGGLIKQNLKSGLTIKNSHKVKFEVDWAHHCLGKEFEANPVPFNQMKLSQYLMGESDILLHCDKPEELRARLKLMHRIGYWTTKY